MDTYEALGQGPMGPCRQFWARAWLLGPHMYPYYVFICVHIYPYVSLCIHMYPYVSLNQISKSAYPYVSICILMYICIEVYMYRSVCILY